MLAAATPGSRVAEPAPFRGVPLRAVPLSSLPAGTLTPLKELLARGRAAPPPPRCEPPPAACRELKRRAGGPPGRESPAKVFQRMKAGAPRPQPGPAADPILTPAALHGGRRGPHRQLEGAAAPRAGTGTGPGGGRGGAGGSWPGPAPPAGGPGSARGAGGSAP